MLKNNYYIFRHGETFASRDGVPYGKREHSTSILPEALPALTRLGAHLKDVKTTKNFTSELKRCVETSKLVGELSGKKFTKNELLNEYLEDSFAEFRERIKMLVRKLEKSEGETYLLCTHGAVISALKHLLLSGKYHLADLMDYPKTGTLLIINKAGTLELLDFN